MLTFSGPVGQNSGTPTARLLKMRETDADIFACRAFLVLFVETLSCFVTPLARAAPLPCCGYFGVLRLLRQWLTFSGPLIDSVNF